jgi:hypothetical protein
LIAGIATACVAASAAPALAASPDLTIGPATPTVDSTCFPFDVANTWTPYAAFIYKNIPPFAVVPGDQIRFDSDSGNVSGQTAQEQIDLAPTTTNGGDVPAAPFVPVVTNSTPAIGGPGDSIVGNYDLRFNIVTPFSFPGGGLIIRFSNPAGPFASDTSCAGGIHATSALDASDHFVKRAFGDTDGTAPWSGASTGVYIGAFRISVLRPCQGRTATIIGTNGADTLTGTPAADVIDSGPGNDLVKGLGGNDVICGDAGRDRLIGGNGADSLNGGTGKDTEKGGRGKDKLKGAPGPDKLIGGPGNDLLIGGPGNDLLLGGPGRDRLNGGPGRDKLRGGPKHDKLRGGPGRDSVKQ